MQTSPNLSGEIVFKVSFLVTLYYPAVKQTKSASQCDLIPTHVFETQTLKDMRASHSTEGAALIVVNRGQHGKY